MLQRSSDMLSLNSYLTYFILFCVSFALFFLVFVCRQSADLPPRPVLDKLQQLITYGTQMGYIQRNYVLLGHRQVKATECPGNRLYNALRAWPHYVQHTT